MTKIFLFFSVVVTCLLWAETEEDIVEPEHSPVEATLILHSGAKINGFLAHGESYEANQQGAWVYVSNNHPDAGLRLWFPWEGRDYIFYPKTKIDKVIVGREVPENRWQNLMKNYHAKQLLYVEDEQINSERLEKSRRLEKKLYIDNLKKQLDAEHKALEKVKSELAALKKHDLEILKKFPVDKWTPETANVIEKRRIVMHIQPTVEEQQFLDNLDEWIVAYQVYVDRVSKREELEAKEKASHDVKRKLEHAEQSETDKVTK